MRPVSFSALLSILRLIAEYAGGLRAGELDDEIKKRGVLSTKKGSLPARTTLYHHRNTLFRLGALRRQGPRLYADLDNQYVEKLLRYGKPTEVGSPLAPEARDTFSEMVLNNEDCAKLFFNLFMPPDLSGPYGLQQFRVQGRSVVWRRVHTEGRSEVLLRAETNLRATRLRSPSEIKGVLYGLRYWARDELELVDEFFREDRGSVVYPVVSQDAHLSAPKIVEEIFSFLLTDEEWTVLSVRELIVRLCEERRRPLKSLFAALRVLEAEYPRYVVFVPTSRGFATLTATSVAREEFELRGYFKDATGRYISHLRIHNTVRRQLNAQAR